MHALCSEKAYFAILHLHFLSTFKAIQGLAPTYISEVVSEEIGNVSIVKCNSFSYLQRDSAPVINHFDTFAVSCLH